MAAAVRHTSIGNSLLVLLPTLCLSFKLGGYLQIVTLPLIVLTAPDIESSLPFELCSTYPDTDSSRIPSTPSPAQGSWGAQTRPDSTQVPWIPNHHPYSQGMGPAAANQHPASPNPNYSTASFSTASASHYSQKPGRPSFSRGGAASASALDLAQYIEQQHLLKGSQKEPKARNGTPSKNWRVIVFAVVSSLALATLAVMVPVYFKFFKPGHSASFKGDGADFEAHGGDGGGDGGSFNDTSGPTSGGVGSTIRLENGTTFTYSNPYGGYWVHNPADPFNLDATPNTWTPPLNTTWSWTENRISGVNLGGWLVLEPFITPGIFQRYPGAVDEFTLTRIMREQGTLAELEEHYATFITEQDIADIASAGLNWLRVPLGFWAVETYEGEPFLERTSWTYFLRVVEWARKYGLRIYLDLHAVPGGQNGMNHSGRQHHISFLNGNMGLANAQRTLFYLRVITQFISQPQYASVIQILGILNEPLSFVIGMDALTSWYVEAYRVIRGVTGYGEGNGPYIAIGDGLLPNADRVIMDVHPYVAFDEGINAAPVAVPAADGQMGGTWPSLACRRWGSMVNRTKSTIGLTIAGEFSSALNDCGLFHSIHNAPLYNAWEEWNDDMTSGLRSFVQASMDALWDWFFWTWKVHWPASDGRITAPFWSYQLGLEQGGCQKILERVKVNVHHWASSPVAFDGKYQPWQTDGIVAPTATSPDATIDGGASPTLPSSYLAAHPWPPAHIEHADVSMDLLPTYTNTRELVRLPAPTYSERAWRWGGPIEGCQYPDIYEATFPVLPTANCPAE
ncbi:exo-beta-1,3-glucanase [Coprinopsis sp. MPI-PUGE-AT-0042]|nr:exo-beta-1,3-glucanase [Coprinopsis sp. MPI-PUGE-AT-0042]